MRNECVSAFVIPSVVEESLTTLPDMIRDVSTSLDMTENSHAQDES
jgi:predicted transcriptional regulator